HAPGGLGHGAARRHGRLRRPRASRHAGVRGAARYRARPRRPRYVLRADRVGEPAARRLHAARLDRRRREACARALPVARGAQVAAGGDAERRRAADARDRPRDDAAAAVADGRRAVARPGAARRRRDLPRAEGAEREGRHGGAARRAERAQLARRLASRVPARDRTRRARRRQRRARAARGHPQELPGLLMAAYNRYVVGAFLAACAIFLVVGSLQSALFAQLTVSGLANGGIYASLGVALVLIYRATQVINFAQGAIATFTTYVAWQLMTWGLSYWPAFFLTLGIAFVGGTLVELITIRPVERRGNVLTVVIATLGLLILVEGSVGWIWGAEIRFMPSAFPAHSEHLGGVAFSLQDLGTIGISIASVIVLWALFRFTKIGLGMRAAAFRPQAARLVGVRVSWMLSLGWGLAV